MTWETSNIIPGGGLVAPGVCLHGGEPWCMWVAKDHSLNPRVFDPSVGPDSWVQRGVVPGESTSYTPAMAELNDFLHVIFVSDDNNRVLLHSTFDDSTGYWSRQEPPGQSTQAAPTLAPHNGKLFCAFVDNRTTNSLLYSLWDPEAGWQGVFATGEASWGAPALVEIRGSLHLIFASFDKSRTLIDLVLNDSAVDLNKAWTRNSVLHEESAGGVSASSFGRFGYLFFPQNDGSGTVLYSSCFDAWASSRSIGQTSCDTPQCFVYDGGLHALFLAKNDTRSVLWSKGTLASDLNAEWLGSVPGIEDRTLGALCLPGTHDSGAYSLTDTFVPDDLLYEVPLWVKQLHGNEVELVLLEALTGIAVEEFIDGLVRDMSLAQELPVGQQLLFGTRSIDLRACYVDGDYYTFHAVLGNSIASILREIASFLDSTSSELVYLWASPRGMSVDQLGGFYSLIRDIVGAYCLPISPGLDSSHLKDLRVSDVLASGGAANKSRLIVFNDSKEFVETQSPKLIWQDPANARYANYSDTSSLDTMLSDSAPGQAYQYSQRSPNQMFELCFTLTPQTNDIIAEAVARLVELKVSDSVIGQFCSVFGIDVAVPPPNYSGLHELSMRATQALTAFDSQWSGAQFNFISLDFVNDTPVVDIAKRRCGSPSVG